MKKNNTWRKFKRNWKHRMPKFWKWVCVTCTSLSGAAGVGLTTMATFGLTTGYEKYILIFVGATASIAAFAKTRVEMPKKETK